VCRSASFAHVRTLPASAVLSSEIRWPTALSDHGLPTPVPSDPRGFPSNCSAGLPSATSDLSAEILHAGDRGRSSARVLVLRPSFP
jgi:hypothetical protein